MISFEDDLYCACQTLKKGGIILYPTDTVWGIGCDAGCSEAVARIFKLKQREDSKAMISLVADTEMLKRYAGAKGAEMYGDVSKQFAKPVSMIFPKVDLLSDNLLAADGSCALRITSERFSHGLCRGIDGALVSTSANISGSATARFFNEIAPEIVSGVDYVVSYRRDDLSEHEPSAVLFVDPSTYHITVLRP